MCVLAIVWLSLAGTAAQSPAPAPAALGCSDMETFLKTAKIGRQRSIPVGVTVPSRATLDNGTLQHDASIQTIDETKTTYTTARGTEFNFRDSWQFNVAGYELAKMLELNMVPPYVERTVSGKRASVSWWVGDTMMERDRVKAKTTPPDTDMWNAQVLAGRAFHELIADTDVNMTNLLITKDWRVWAIDHTRAFRMQPALRKPENVTRCDRQMFERLKQLDRAGLERELRGLVDSGRIRALLSRRDAIVKRIESLGPAALFDRQAPEPLARTIHEGPNSPPFGLRLRPEFSGLRSGLSPGEVLSTARSAVSKPAAAPNRRPPAHY